MTPSPMHTLIITPRLLHSALLRSALQRQNIKSLVCTPGSLVQDWCPSTDAIVFPHLLEKPDWKSVLPFLMNVSPKLPLIFLQKVDPILFSEPHFRTLARQSILMDQTLSIDEIPLLVKDVIQKTPSGENFKEVDLGGFTLDRSQRLVRVGKDENILTKKEFFLLELLIKHPGRVISRDMIIDHLWDQNTYVESNTVDVTMSRLRKKLNVKRSDPLIRTVPSLGYQLCVRKTKKAPKDSFGF